MLKKDQIAEWEEKNWKRKAYYDKKGNVIIPGIWFRGAIINAARQTRLVPNFATSKKQTFTNYVESFIVENIGEKYKEKMLEYDGQYVDGQGGRGGSKVWRIRPRLDNWTAKLRIVDPAGRMLKDELKALLEYAGMFVGVGDGKKINYGRFEIITIMEAN
jgi:hypothetical protein